jgi:DedD protein
MGLLSFLQRSSDTPSEPAPAPDAVAAARIRARRRLIGATVLLAIGIVGFPLLFETQPRPVPVDVPIELARKDGAAGALAAPLASAPGAVLTDSSSTAPAAASRPLAVKSAEGEVTERAEEQGRERPPPAAAAATRPTTAVADAAVAAGAGAAVAAAAVVPKAPTQAAAPAPSANKAAEAHAAASKPAAPRPAASTAATGEAARARALLNDRAAASAPAGRMVVQVGAFTEADKLREARSKVEKLGFKTYTQVVSTEAGKRTRVRVGPFATRAEADKAASRLKAAGLSAAILTL